VAKTSAMPLSTSFDNSLEESNSYLEFKDPQDTRFRLRTTDWKISDQDLTDAQVLRTLILKRNSEMSKSVIKFLEKNEFFDVKTATEISKRKRALKFIDQGFMD
jgi:hypothetical protein